MYLPSQLILNGNVGGKDPEEVKDGMVAFSVATSQGKDRDPCWTDVICFEETARGVLENVTAGDSVIVTGRLAFDTWQDNDGNKRSKHKMIADEVAIKARPAKDAIPF